MTYQSREIFLDANKFRYAVLCVLLMVFSALKIESAMAVGRAECSDLSIPVVLVDVTRFSQTIFTAKIIGMIDLGIIKLKDGESLIYSKMNIVVEDVLKAASGRNITPNQELSVFIISENYAKVSNVTEKIFDAGEHALFTTDNSRYTISGDNDYDKKIYAEIEKRIKTPIWNGDTIVALPCEYGVYHTVDDYIAELLTRIRDYIHLQR